MQLRKRCIQQSNCSSSRKQRLANIDKAACQILSGLIFTVALLRLCWKETPQHFTLASGILCTESRPQSQQSAENRCHQTRSIVSSVLSASPVTLPALSLYPQASSITYQAGRSDVTTPAHTLTNHSPNPLRKAAMQNTKTPGAALNMAGCAQVSQHLGIRIFWGSESAGAGGVL